MSDTTSVIMVGVGGQGILLASEVLARAAMQAGFDVKTNEVHGMAQRGGSVMAQVRYGEEVHSPLILEGTATALLSLESIESLRAAHYLKDGGLAVVNTQRVIPVTVSSGAAKYPEDDAERVKKVFPKLKAIDAVAIAGELGNIRAANVVLLGALSLGLDLEMEHWAAALDGAVKPQFRELNQKAFEAGRNL